MRRTLLYCLLSLVAASSFAARQIVPLAGHLSGGGGTFWTTDISLTNLSGSFQQVLLIFHPAPGITRTRSLDLAAGESRLLSDAVNPALFGEDATSSWSGLLEVISAGEVKTTARIFTGAGSSSGSFGSSFDAVDPSILPFRGLITGVLSSPGFRTNVAFSNPTGLQQSFRFEIRDASGAIRHSDSLPVPALNTIQIPLANYLSIGEDIPFSISWASDDRGFAMASVLDNKSGDPTSVPSVTVSSNRLFFPVVGRTAGASNTFWTTSLTVTSDSDLSGELTLRFFGDHGLQAERTETLSAHGSFRTDDLFRLLNLTSGSGLLIVDTTIPVVGSARLFNTTADGSTFGSAVPAQDRIAEATRLRIHGVRRDDDFRLNVGIADDNRVAAVGTIRLFDDHGGLVESRQFSVNPMSSAQFSMNQTSRQVRGGEVEIEVENGVTVVAISSNVDNRSGDTTMGEVEQENERQQHAEVSFSPRTATAGVPVTLTANLPGFSDAAFSWNFGDGATANGKTVTHTFQTPGELIVTVIATLAGGATVRESEDITVISTGGGVGTNLDFTWTPANPVAGQVVTFTASGANGTVKWHFPGDIRKTGNPVSFTFTANGSFEVEAESEREGSPTIRVMHYVNVGGGGGGTNFDFIWTPANPIAGQSVTFTASGVNGLVKWHFPGDVRKTGNPVSFTFATNGSFEVEAELEREGSLTIRVKHFVTVGGGTGGGGTPGTGATSIDFSWTPANPKRNQAVTFSATFDQAPVSGGTVKWKFPDDSRPTGNPVTYTFTSSGSFEVEAELEQHGRPSLERKRVVTVTP